MYDIIGDVHGYADRLEALLKRMGYREHGGVYQHPERTLISVGDLIDRGPQQRRSVDIIRNMCEQGFAHCIMGNHEFNAVAWTIHDSKGNYLREHSDKNFDQHHAFLKEAEQDPSWYADTIAWFKSLPLYLDLPQLRVVHACWHEPSLTLLNQYADNGALKEEAWCAANTKGHALYHAIEVLSKGWEVELPDGYAFLDKDKHPRTAIRTKWWQEESPTYRNLAMGVENLNDLPDTVIPGDVMPGYDNAKPLFIGHYWMKGQPQLQSKMIACVDWSVGDSGKMVGYRLQSNALSDRQFFAV
ncbi:metallophosphoesterase [Pseudidiomarina sediminum]|uniref:metallophosphoesterase n=1 Tax=Pseudidiomarina sediminum TaxID=431675 RepID=UPI001C96393F|nr:metallophosphoesterase [Pseudidiomarina sediminum]MBY6064515.1 metallophosphoesterase [Pseudidiomarina sediminum]